jgi:sterol desaturase/sphingolipid hydroxylase (fatty acid hydroxylase superfamily)
MLDLAKLRRLAASHGPLLPGRGLRSGVLALALAIGCVLGVLAFHFPQQLSTPELRALVPVEWLRRLLVVSLVVAGAIALVNLVFDRQRWLASAAFALVVLALLGGGHRVPVADGAGIADGGPYLGLDWFVLDLLVSALVFVVLEKLFPLRREQPLFRPGWQTDLQHFAVNHLLVGLLSLAANTLVQRGFGWAAHDGLRGWVAALPWWAALPLILLVADLAQYALHRAYHELRWLWPLHAVHHSSTHMDWLAGSRQHLLEVLLTRTLVLAAIFLAGFDKAVVDVYIVIVGFHAVFIHANVNLRLGPLRHLVVTPEFHHWHHGSERAAIDRNYAAHFSFIDRLFGTAVRADSVWPQRYGVVGDGVPGGFWAQLRHPFEALRR